LYHMIATNLSSARPSVGKLRNKRGQTLVEYALILSFISVVAISVLIATGGKVKGVFTTINSQLSTAQKGGSGTGTSTQPPTSGG
jgi:Flp pilus assembly pilin Flp